MSNNRVYNVKNRSAGMVVYTIPEIGRREFAPGETKKLTYNELEKLSFLPGGPSLMSNFLQILDDGIISNLNIHAENEYYMNETQIVELLQNGSLDAFLDCLDYAPVGVIDLVKTYAVQLPLNDIEKRKALKEKTGFDVDVAIRHIEEEKMEEAESTKAAEKTTSSAAPSTGRRTATQYKVVTTDKE